MSHWPWDILELEPTNDEREIKRAYARLIKTVHPDADPEGFQRIRAAYEQARVLARQEAEDIEETDDEDDIADRNDAWIETDNLTPPSLHTTVPDAPNLHNDRFRFPSIPISPHLLSDEQSGRTFKAVSEEEMASLQVAMDHLEKLLQQRADPDEQSAALKAIIEHRALDSIALRASTLPALEQMIAHESRDFAHFEFLVDAADFLDWEERMEGGMNPVPTWKQHRTLERLLNLLERERAFHQIKIRSLLHTGKNMGSPRVESLLFRPFSWLMCLWYMILHPSMWQSLQKIIARLEEDYPELLERLPCGERLLNVLPRWRALNIPGMVCASVLSFGFFAGAAKLLMLFFALWKPDSRNDVFSGPIEVIAFFLLMGIVFILAILLAFVLVVILSNAAARIKLPEFEIRKKLSLNSTGLMIGLPFFSVGALLMQNHPTLSDYAIPILLLMLFILHLQHPLTEDLHALHHHGVVNQQNKANNLQADHYVALPFSIAAMAILIFCGDMERNFWLKTVGSIVLGWHSWRITGAGQKLLAPILANPVRYGTGVLALAISLSIYAFQGTLAALPPELALPANGGLWLIYLLLLPFSTMFPGYLLILQLPMFFVINIFRSKFPDFHWDTYYLFTANQFFLQGASALETLFKEKQK